MQRVFFTLLAFAPGLRAQVARPSDATVASTAVAVAAPGLTPVIRKHGPTVGSDEAQLFGRVFGSGTPAEGFRSDLLAGLALDSARATQQKDHALLGAVLGLGLGAGAGYAVAISRVRDETAEYMVLSAAKIAPRPMRMAIALPMVLTSVTRIFDCSA